MTQEDKNWIDNATYEQLLQKWRYAPSGSTLFQGETGAYYAKVMTEKRNAVGHEAAVAASKSVGWDGP